MMTRHQTVMEFLTETDEYATFVQAHDEGEGSEQYELSLVVWEHMGKPDQITLTVEPGDRLNIVYPAIDAGVGTSDIPTQKNRSAVTGQYVSEETARENPDTTVSETD